MRMYFSTCITGLEPQVSKLLREHVDDVVIHHESDGLIFYSSARSYKDLRSLPFVTNTFICFSHTTARTTEEKTDPVKLVKRLHEEADVLFVKNIISKNNQRVFRVRVSHEGQLIGIPKKIQLRIEQSIMHKTPYTLDPVRSDLEFWFLIRRDGHAYFGMKEVRRQPKKEKGSLSEDLAYILCWLGTPAESDILFDPFAGSGSIPFTAARHFSCKHIIASDYDLRNVHAMKHAQTHLKKKVDIHNWDVLHLRELTNQSIDVIVTDPPWGIYKKTDINIKKFYYMMLQELRRILKKDGILVILTSQKELLDDTILRFDDALEISDIHHILVSGKKAGVYRLKRT